MFVQQLLAPDPRVTLSVGHDKPGTDGKARNRTVSTGTVGGPLRLRGIWRPMPAMPDQAVVAKPGPLACASQGDEVHGIP